MDDALIAATAQAAGMVLVTGNARHVAPLGVAYLDPWEITPRGMFPRKHGHPTRPDALCLPVNIA